MSDGSIRVETSLDNKPIEQGAKETELILDKTGKKISAGAKEAAQEVENAIDRTAENIKKSAEKIITAPDDTIKGLTKYVEKVTERVAAAKEELEKVKQEIADWKKSAAEELDKATPEQANNYLAMYSKDVQSTIQRQEELNSKIKEWESDIAAATQEINRLTAAEQEEARVKSETKIGGAELKNAISNSDFIGAIQNVQQYNSILSETRTRIAMIEQEAARIAQDHNISKEQLLSENSEYQKLISKLNLLINNQDQFKRKVKETKTAAVNTGAGFRKMEHSLKQCLLQVIRIGIGLIGLRSIYTGLRRMASAYMNDNQAMTNQLTAVWGVLGQMIGPVIEWLINLLSTAIGYINVFYKALTGVDAIAAYNAKQLNKESAATDKLAGSTNKLAKAQKQLASFDEMNKLQDTSNTTPSTSTGGAAAGIADLATFKTPELDPNFVKQIQWLAKNIKTILKIAGLVGAAFLAWKISSALGLGLKGLIGIFNIIVGLVIGIKGYIDAWQNGINWSNLTQIVGGFALAVSGVAIAFGSTAAAITGVVAGISLIVLGFKDWINNGATVQNLAAIEIGIIAIGAAISIITESPVALIGAAVVGLGVAVVSLAEHCGDTSGALHNFTDEQYALFDAVHKSSDAMRDQISTSNEAAAGIVSQYAHYEKLWQELQNIADASGKVQEKDQSRAKFILGELNKALGTQYSMQDGVIQQYDDMKKKIESLIETKKYELLLNEYGDDYVQALKNEEAAYQALQDATLAYKDHLDEITRYRQIDAEMADLQRQRNEECAKSAIEYDEGVITSIDNKMAALVDEKNGIEKNVGDIISAYDTATADYKVNHEAIMKYQNAEMAAAEGNYKQACDILLGKQSAYADSSENIKGSIQDVIDQLGEQATAAKQKAETFRTNWENGVEGFTESMVKEAEDGYNDTLAKFNNAKKSAYAIGSNFTVGLKNGMFDNKKSIFDLADEIAVGVPDKLETQWQIKSPSKKAKTIGGYFMDGLENGFIGKKSSVLSTIGSIASGLLDKMKNVLGIHSPSTEGESIGMFFDMGIANGVTKNTVGIIKSIDKQCEAITEAYDRVSFGINTPYISAMNVPKLAAGGIVNNPGRGVNAIIGEAGAEAVLPLENNTKWMDVLADKIGTGNVTIPITLDGKTIAKYIVNIQQKRAFAANGGY